MILDVEKSFRKQTSDQNQFEKCGLTNKSDVSKNDDVNIKAIDSYKMTESWEKITYQQQVRKKRMMIPKAM